MGFDGAFNIIFWVGLTVFVIFGVVFPLLVFGAAVLEKQHVTTLRPLTEQEQRRQPIPPEVLGMIALDDRPLGVQGFRDSGTKVTPTFLLLSGDRLVSVRVWLWNKKEHNRFELLSRLHSGHWLVTADTLPFRDLSGLRWEVGLPNAPLAMALQRHRQRMGEARQPCVPFAAETAMTDLAEHERQRVARLVEHGLARYVGPDKERWVFTLRGALKMAWQTTGIMKRYQEDQKRVEAMKKESAPPLLKE
jgi:hypothetical protein